MLRPILSALAAAVVIAAPARAVPDLSIIRLTDSFKCERCAGFLEDGACRVYPKGFAVPLANMYTVYGITREEVGNVTAILKRDGYYHTFFRIPNGVVFLGARR